MLHVLLHQRFLGLDTRIVLQYILVRTPDEDVVVARVDVDAVGDPLALPALDALPRLRVPVPHHLVKPDRRELLPVLRKVDIAHRLRVAHVGPRALARVVHVPDLDLAVHGRREQQVSAPGEPPDSVHSLGVSRPGVHALLGDVALVGGRLDVGRSVDPGTTLIVAGHLAVEHGLCLGDPVLDPLLRRLHLGLGCLCLLRCLDVLGELLGLGLRERGALAREHLARRCVRHLPLLRVPLRRLVHRPAAHLRPHLLVAHHVASTRGV
mmetsp:Transcript_64482/g.151899  ORF Transcript_64482/g.151899 Transcript_64482/m.151899 type:complete len:266 (-) Transcript_64482:434-1231(-)